RSVGVSGDSRHRHGAARRGARGPSALRRPAFQGGIGTADSRRHRRTARSDRTGRTRHAQYVHKIRPRGSALQPRWPDRLLQGGARLMFAVLLYHGIDDGTPSARQMDDVDREYVLDRRRFESHVEYLAATPATAVPVVVSFDDGDLSCHTTAAPIL